MSQDDPYSRLAVIPARGGSVRLKNKNVYPLGGKPLICHTIEAVIDSGCFDTIVVSTDSELIASEARKYKEVDIYDRPTEYATERITVLDALLTMMVDLEHHDIFAYFLPTCPFRNADDISGGVKLLAPGVDSVISISQMTQPPQLAMLKRGDDVFPVFDNLGSVLTNSRYFQKHYKRNGGYYMGWWDTLKKNRYLFIVSVKGFELPQERTVDIDDIFDIHLAEQLLHSNVIKNEKF